MCSSEEKSEDHLPGLAPKGSPLICDLVLFQSSPTVKVVLDPRESGEVRSEKGAKRFFQQRHEGFASVGSCVVGGDRGPFRGQRNHLSLFTGTKTSEKARLPHDSSLYGTKY